MAQINGYKEELQDELQKTDPDSHASRLLAQEIERLEKGDDRKDRGIAFVDVHPDQPQNVGLKVRIPVREYPRFNFVGKLLGPKGNTLKRLQEETGCKMAILGKGSMKDKGKEDELRKEGGKKYSHLNDELHVYVEAFAEMTDGYRRLSHAVAELQKFLIPSLASKMDEEEEPSSQEVSLQISSQSVKITNPITPFEKALQQLLSHPMPVTLPSDQKQPVSFHEAKFPQKMYGPPLKGPVHQTQGLPGTPCASAQGPPPNFIRGSAIAATEGPRGSGLGPSVSTIRPMISSQGPMTSPRGPMATPGGNMGFSGSGTVFSPRGGSVFPPRAGTFPQSRTGPGVPPVAGSGLPARGPGFPPRTGPGVPPRIGPGLPPRAGSTFPQPRIGPTFPQPRIGPAFPPPRTGPACQPRAGTAFASSGQTGFQQRAGPSFPPRGGPGLPQPRPGTMFQPGGGPNVPSNTGPPFTPRATPSFPPTRPPLPSDVGTMLLSSIVPLLPPDEFGKLFKIYQKKVSKDGPRLAKAAKVKKPKKVVRKDRQSTPWYPLIHEEFHHLIRLRRRAERKWLKSQDPEDKRAYIVAMRKVHNLVRKAKEAIGMRVRKPKPTEETSKDSEGNVEDSSMEPKNSSEDAPVEPDSLDVEFKKDSEEMTLEPTSTGEESSGQVMNIDEEKFGKPEESTAQIDAFASAGESSDDDNLSEGDFPDDRSDDGEEETEENYRDASLSLDGNDEIRQQQFQEMMYMSSGEDTRGGRGGYRGGPASGRGGPVLGRGALRGAPGRGAPGRGGAGAPRGAGGALMRGSPRGRGGATHSQSSGYDDYGYDAHSHGGGSYDDGYDSRGYGESRYGDRQGDGHYYGSGSRGQSSSAAYDDYSGYDYGDSWGGSGNSGGPMKSSSRGGAKPRSHPYGGGY